MNNCSLVIFFIVCSMFDHLQSIFRFFTRFMTLISEKFSQPASQFTLVKIHETLIVPLFYVINKM